MFANVSLNFFVLIKLGVRVDNVGIKLPISDNILNIKRELFRVGD